MRSDIFIVPLPFPITAENRLRITNLELWHDPNAAASHPYSNPEAVMDTTIEFIAYAHPNR